jgi:hypothetical protein
MPELLWYEIFLPRNLNLDSVTSFVRPLASRPRIGIRQRTPLVVFEQWATAGEVRYLVGIEPPLTENFIRQLAATVPSLTATSLITPPRTRLQYGSDIRLTSVAASLRTDVAVAVSVAQSAALAAAGDDTLVVQWIIGPAHDRRHRPTPFEPLVQLGLQGPPTLTTRDKTLWEKKTVEPIFAVRGRIGTTGNLGKLHGLRAAIQQADSATGHLIVGPPSRGIADKILILPRPRWGGIVNGRELAVLLAWPQDGGEYAHRLPLGDQPPLSSSDGRPLGLSLHPVTTGQTVVMPQSALSRHLYVIGPTGSGKSNLIARMALADIAAGRAVVVIEPKGDLVDAILERLDAAVVDRAVVVDGGEAAYPVGSNPVGGDEDSAERRADEVVGLFRSLHGTALGPRSTDVMLHAVLLAARTGGTLPDVPVLLTNAGFRARTASAISDPLVLDPWLAWFEAISDNERAQVVAPILNKLRAFTARASLRRVLGQANPGWTFDHALGQRGIVLVSLNRGVLGPEATALLGALLMGQLWSAIQRRTRLPQAQRPLASVYVDEWQLFTGGLDFADVLATARGMSVSITVANQDLSQIDHSLRAALAANTRSKVSFAPARDDAKSLAGLLGSANVTDRDLLHLGQFEAVGTNYGTSGAFHFRTEPLPPKQQSASTVRRASQRRFGHPGDAVDAALLDRWNHAPNGGIGRRRRSQP